MGIKLFHTDKAISGLDISTTGIKIMSIDPKKMTILGYGAIDLDPIKVQDGLLKGDSYLAEGLKKLLKEKLVGRLPSNQVVACAPTSRTYSRIMNVPIDAASNLSEAVQLEAEQYIPITRAELALDYQVIERDEKELTVLVSAVPKRIVNSIMETCSKAGLDLIMIEPAINAAARLVKLTEEGHLPSVIIDIGAATTDIALLDSGTVRVTSSVIVGGNTFTLKISEGLKISLEEAHQLKVHSGLAAGANQAKLKVALEGTMNQIVNEMRKMIRYYNERVGVKTKIEQIVIVGGGSNMPGLGEYITEAMMMPARVGDPWGTLSFGNLQPPSRLFKQRYITAAGLSIVEPKGIWK